MEICRSFEKEVKNASQDLVERIRSDILNGMFPPHQPLPSYKEMRFRYSTNFRTLKKALATLFSEGLLQRHKRTYEPVMARQSKSSTHIRFLGPATGEKKIALSICSENTPHFIEKTCRQMNVIPEFYGYGTREYAEPFEPLNIEGSNWFLPMGSKKFVSLADSDSVSGYVVFRTAPTGDEDFVFRWLSHVAKKPVIICDIVGDFRVPRYLTNSKNGLFSVAISTNTGRQAAKYLHELGHRHIAYISPFHQAKWSVNRLRGVRSLFDIPGSGRSVRSFVLDNPPKIFDFYSEDAHKLCSVTSLNNAFEQWKENVPAAFSRAAAPFFSFTLPFRLLSRAALEQEMEKLFDRALEQKEITAWVCSNDIIALMALDYLERKDITVPQEISVLGFDDSEQAYTRRLTSYNFNVDILIYRIINSILNPRVFPKSHKAVEIDGMIMERDTTGRRKESS
ncbi:MAG: GntR family transcriptional regulator [Chitinivibrionales bacterium]|nr:GntR family transcriptional regulator [Chitinivibrionales bacterium]